LKTNGKTRKTFDNDCKILIIGGYGHVGRLIAERLAPMYPGRVVIAGRNINKASVAAMEIGYGVDKREIDLFSKCSSVTAHESQMDDVVLVLVCMDQNQNQFVEQCIKLGINYVDISADYDFISQVEKLNNLAVQYSTCVIQSVGVAPGLTNLLASWVTKKMKSIERIDILLELGLGDHHGQAAIEWMFDNLDSVYEVNENGQIKTVRSFNEQLDLALPTQPFPRPAYRFNFSDQHVLVRTLGIPSISTWFRFDDRVSTWVLAKISQKGGGKLLRRKWFRKIAVWLFLNVHMGSDTCGVAVRAVGDNKKTLTFGLVGRKEALMTAIVATETVRQVLSGSMPSGVYHSEQVIQMDPVITALKHEIKDMVISL